MNTTLPHTWRSRRPGAPFARVVFIAACGFTASCAAGAIWSTVARGSDPAAFPLADASPRPHAVGDVFNYSLHGTLSQAIVGHDPFGRSVRQGATPTDVQGRERIAVRFVTPRGLSLHRSGSILATFNGRTSHAQTGTGWTLVTPQGNVEDRKGSTLGGLFLLPLSFLAEHAVDGGTLPSVGDRWNGKLGMALFGMTAQPRLHYRVSGTRRVFDTVVYTLLATGNAPVKEPIVTNEGVALGNAVGIARVSLRCDYDPMSLRAVSMEINVDADLRIQSGTRAGAGRITDRQHYLVALDAQSMQAAQPASDPPAPHPAAQYPAAPHPAAQYPAAPHPAAKYPATPRPAATATPAH